MIKATIYVDTEYCRNEIFNKENETLNRDDCLRYYRSLRDSLKENDFDLSTQDINSIRDSAFVIYHDVPKRLPVEHVKEKSILLLYESEVVKPMNWSPETLDKFQYILTWNDDYVDNAKFFKFNFPQISFRTIDSKKGFDEKKFCCMISANKKSTHKKELYSERIKAIKWFDSHHPEQFDLYGYGWDSGIDICNNKLLKKILKITHLKKDLDKYIPKSYKGCVSDKIKTFSQYKYSICYENAWKIPGYITEKIFDSFIAGVVPIYIGPPNISKYIPTNCYIDKKKFHSYRRLYAFLRNISESEYKTYRQNIEAYLQSDAVEVFSSSYFTNQVCQLVKKIVSAS